MEDLGLDFVIMSPEMLIPLPAPKQDYPQATLYIVASHWASDGEYGSYEIPFTSLIDAQRQFHDDLREEQDGGSIDSWRQRVSLWRKRRKIAMNAIWTVSIVKTTFPLS